MVSYKDRGSLFFSLIKSSSFVDSYFIQWDIFTIIIIRFEAQVMFDLAGGSPFNLVPVSFWQVLIIPYILVQDVAGSPCAYLELALESAVFSNKP